MLSLFKNRNFLGLWLGQTISLVGDSIRDWALIYWIFEASGRSPMVQSISFIVVMAPNLVLGPFAGVLVDRWDRRRVMIVADLLRGAISLALIAAVATGQYWYALGVVFLSSCVAQFFNPARGAMIPRVVGQEQLMQANSLSQTTHSLMQLLGPGLGTAIYHLLGPAGAFTADAASFFLSAGCILLVSTSGAVATSGRPAFVSELKEGLRYAWENRPIRAIILALTVLFMGAGAINTLGIFLVRQVLGLPESAMVYSATAQPLATMLAAIAVGASARKLRRAPLLVSLGLLLATAGIGVTAAAPNLTVLVIGAVLVGLCNAVLNIGISTTVGTFVPDAMRGRLFGTIGSLPMGFMMASAALAGYLAEFMSPRLIMGGGAVFTLLAAFVSYFGLKDVLLPEPARAAEATATA